MDAFHVAHRAKPLLIAASVVAAGCTPQLASWSQAQSVQATEIKPVVLSHPVQFKAGAAAMAAEEEYRLSAFLASVGLTPGDAVTLVVPATSDRLTERREAAVERVLKQHDVDVFALAANRASGNGNVITIRLNRYVAMPPNCAGLDETAANGFSDTPPESFGCTTATNLALMAAHPRDLLTGAPPGGADATHEARAVERYRAGALSAAGGSQGGSGGGSSGGSSGGGGS